LQDSRGLLTVNQCVHSYSFLGKNNVEGALADAVVDGLHDMRAAIDKGADVSYQRILF